MSEQGSRWRAVLGGQRADTGARMTLTIDYYSEGFSASSGVVNGPATLKTSWDDLLWSALTVGRPNRSYVFKHGQSFAYEALFRLSLVRMALEQTGITTCRLRRTSAFRTMDPSEKGAINYFLGLTLCKLFASSVLDAHWLLHLDVFRPFLDPILTGRSRPDLVGRRINGEWIALECKGRISVPDSTAKHKAKLQAQRLISIAGVAPAFNIGGIAYLEREALQFFWRDPAPEGMDPPRPIRLNVEPDAWRHHYALALGLIRQDPAALQRMLERPLLLTVEHADLQLGIRPTVLRSLVSSDRLASLEGLLSGQVEEGGILYQPDGLAIVAGPSWSQPFERNVV